MFAMHRIGQNVMAAFAAAILTTTAVGAAVSPVQHQTASPAAPASLVAATLSSQV